MELLIPGSLDDLLSGARTSGRSPSRPLASPPKGVDGLAGLPTVEAVLEAIAEGRVHSGEVFFIDATSEYVDAKRFLRAEPDAELDGEAVRRFFEAEGGSLLLTGVQDCFPAVGALTSALSGALLAQANTNLYLTPGGAQTFPRHWDTHDVVVLQLEGRKRWILYEPLLEAPLHRHHACRTAELREMTPRWGEIEMQPGGALYIPRGYLHEATAVGGPSLHISSGIHRITWHRLVEVMVADALRECAEDLTFRGDCPAGGAHLAATVREGIAPRVEALVKRLRAIDAAEVLQSLTEPADGDGSDLS
ncbi:JmjC domain-containing protein [Sorangium sp. So ce887]|uniref:JmjC domain-containing protein n=1 Tax=Sorangium sp. So ce887 TaxID=3133324 RepID=UPI003F62995B